MGGNGMKPKEKLYLIESIQYQLKAIERMISIERPVSLKLSLLEEIYLHVIWWSERLEKLVEELKKELQANEQRS